MSSVFLRFVGLFSLSLFLVFTTALAEDSIVGFTPQGKVKPIRQVRAQFSSDLQSFGDPSKPGPFEIRCDAPGKGRWVDGKNWVYDFDRDLSAGVECKFKLKDGIKTRAGKSLTGTKEFTFSSGEPSVQTVLPQANEWNRIQEDQAFVLLFDGTVNGQEDLPKALEGAFFTVSGIQEKIPVKIVNGAERKAIISAQHYESEIKDPVNDSRVVVLSARRRFPNEAKVSLVLSEKQNAVQKFDYTVVKDFVATFSCGRMTPTGPCIPFEMMRISFSSEVSYETARRFILRTPEGQILKNDLKSDLKSNDERETHVSSLYYAGPFAENKKYILEIQKGAEVQDLDGRSLSNAKEYPLDISTGDFPPLAKFGSEFGILEWDAQKKEAVLPVTVRHVEAERVIKGRMMRISNPEKVETFSNWMEKISNQQSGQDRARSVFSTGVEGVVLGEAFEIPKTEKPEQTEVVGIPIRSPGLYVVEIESQILGKTLLGGEKPMYVSTAVLVTESAVHFKVGSESSLVWVTRLADGKPRPNALVSIQDCSGKVLTQLRTDTDGIGRIKGLRNPNTNCPSQVYSSYKSGLFATLSKDEDFSMVHSSWDRGIEPYRFGVDTQSSEDNLVVHAVLDRTLLRAGESLHMKAFFRKHVGLGLALPQSQELPKFLSIEGPSQNYEAELSWDSSGTAEYTWNVPKGAKLGTYTLILKKNKKSDSYSDRVHAGTFQVEEFRLPLMQGSIKPSLVSSGENQAVSADLAVTYLSGGGAAKHPVSFRYRQAAVSSQSFKAFEGYHFANPPIAPGIQTPSSPTDGEADSYQKQNLTLDATGGARVQLGIPRRFSGVNRLEMELEFADPNGEIQTASAFFPIFSTGRLIGVKSSDSWRTVRTLDFAVVSTDGRPQVDARVQVKLFKKNYFSHRKRMVGGFYSYEHREEIKDLGKVCEGKTDEAGKFSCSPTVTDSGLYYLEGQVDDASGRTSYVHEDFYYYGPSTYFGQEDDDRIDLIPQKKSYEAGEKAVFQVRMPFRSATALITVEREGILDSFVVPISSEHPVVEVPIKKNYAPNAFVSAFIVRGRVAEPQPTAVVDLGKPAYKFGLGKINVGWNAHQLKVLVSADRETYKIRQNAQVKVVVQNSAGQAPKKGEVIFAAVDESLLLMKENSSWKLLEAMMSPRPYQVRTYTSQMEVVGKRHFGMKAVPTGGGGGLEKNIARELFETLLLWKTRVPLNAKGEARITVPLNDSVSSFRLVAIAHSGADQFGTGSTSVRTVQDLAILSGLPPLVRQGDRFPAEFTIRNTSAAQMDVEVRGKYQTDKGSATALTGQRILLASGASSIVKWDMTVPSSGQTLNYEIEAKEIENPVAFQALAQDKILIRQKIIPAVPVQVYQATLSQLDGKLDLSTDQPEGALAGKSSIAVTLQPRISDGLTGVVEYMEKYPYTCLEQKVSKQIVLKDKSKWADLMGELPTYLDRDGYARFFPTDQLQGSPSLTAYILNVADSTKKGMEVPEGPRNRMLGALKGFVDGKDSRLSRSGGASTERASEKVMAMEALARYGQLQPQQVTTLEVTPSLWSTATLISWLQVLQRMPALPNRQDRIAEARQNLMSRLNFQGTRMSFSTETQDRNSGFFAAPEINLNRTLLLLADETSSDAGTPNLAAGGGASREDLARLVRAAISRQDKGHWQTTLGNVWGSLAFDQFSKLFEKEPVEGQTDLTHGDSRQVAHWQAGTNLVSQSFEFPSGSNPLSIQHKGKGKPWISVQSRAAIPLKEAISSGFKIQKKITPIEQKKAGEYHKGDILRIQLEIESQSDESWVVVNDPIPAGGLILGTGLGNDSGLMASTGSEAPSGAWPVFQERGFEGFRAYYESVSKGQFTLGYTVRLNQSGLMNLPPTRVEAMYSPEVMGESPNSQFKVLE